MPAWRPIRVPNVPSALDGRRLPRRPEPPPPPPPPLPPPPPPLPPPSPPHACERPPPWPTRRRIHLRSALRSIECMVGPGLAAALDGRSRAVWRACQAGRVL